MHQLIGIFAFRIFALKNVLKNLFKNHYFDPLMVYTLLHFRDFFKKIFEKENVNQN